MKKGNSKDRMFWVAVTILSIVILVNIFAEYIAPYDPDQINMDMKLRPPSAEHWLGTDALGRDMLSRIIYGGRVSIVLALLATTLSMGSGLLIGVLAGYFGGKIDWMISILINIFQGLPSTCFILAIVGVMGPGSRSLLVALVITSWAGFARVVRTEALKVRKESFVEGLKCFGASDMRLIFGHIIPNILPNVSVLFATRLGRCILTISALSYLGLGIRPPTPDWSVMISDARLNYRSAPYLILIPGIFIFLVLFSINILGDHLRDKTDVRSIEVQ
ncbi:MAG: ABC transporter permease [Peptostreptococcaceae bacterium]|nr:ABC transporter permease [Peptostreptococcaceae bacterium]